MPTAGQNLCLSCGLCCDGTLYTRASSVGAAEPVEAFRAAGLRITHRHRDAKGRYRMPLPCLRFENGRCGTYGCRPAHCSSYRCRLLLARAIRLVGEFMAGMDESRRRRFREVHSELLLVAASLGDCLKRFRPSDLGGRLHGL